MTHFAEDSLFYSNDVRRTLLKYFILSGQYYFKNEHYNDNSNNISIRLNVHALLRYHYNVLLDEQ